MRLPGFGYKATVQQWRKQIFVMSACKKRADKNPASTYNIAGFTVGFLLYCVERLPPQLVLAHHAGEALHVEDLVHGCAASAFPNNILPTASTAACHQKEGTWVSASSHLSLGRKYSCMLPSHSKQQEHGSSASTGATDAIAGNNPAQWNTLQCYPSWNDLEKLETGPQNYTEILTAGASGWQPS